MTGRQIHLCLGMGRMQAMDDIYHEIGSTPEENDNWVRIANKSSPSCTQSQRDFPEIITHADEKGELCYRTHYVDPERNAAHKVFMKDNGWVNDGECRFNSGNGHLYIYRRNK